MNNPNGRAPRRNKKSSLATWLIFVVGFILGVMAAQLTSLVVVTNKSAFDNQANFDTVNLKLNNNGTSTLAATIQNETSTQTPRQQSVAETTDENTTSAIQIATQTLTKQIYDTKNNYQQDPTVIKLQEFVKHGGVVVATKIHGEEASINQLRQMLCLFHYAYNNRVLYDIIVYSTVQVPEDTIKMLQDVVSPAKLTVIKDNPGLHEMISQLTPEQQQHLLERCDKKDIKDFAWSTKCVDIKTRDPIAYCWQAEFRAKHLWTHPSLSPYSTMIWIDSDAFCTKAWPRDPIPYFLQNQLVIMFAHFPMGRSLGTDWQDKFIRAFNRTLCRVGMDEWGYLWSQRHQPRAKGADKDNCPAPIIHQIHGFFHITNLDFYRSPRVLNWFNILIGDMKFSRRYDDQIGVTAPAAVWAPEKSVEMEKHGYDLDVFHNGRFDGKDWAEKRFHENFWIKNGTTNFPEAHGKCVVNNPGR